MERTEYIALRAQYKPASVKLAVIAESPPSSELYFYKPGRRSEPLFGALTKLIGLDPSTLSTKEDGLHKFQQRGWILVDATYQPVNKIPPGSRRDQIIIRDYPVLRADLLQLTPDRAAPLLLIKVNLCRILEPRLVRDGFNVLNRGSSCRFPAPANNESFGKGFAQYLNFATAEFVTPAPRLDLIALLAMPLIYSVD